MNRLATSVTLSALGLVVFISIAGAQSLTSQHDRMNGTPPPGAPVPATACTFVIDGTLGSGSTDHASTSGQQTGRLFRDGVASACAAPKSCLPFDSAPGRAYDAYEFNNETGAPACVTVGLDVHTQAACNLQVNGYIGSYNPANLCLNYAADPGLSSGSPPALTSFSFDVLAGGHFILVVHTTNPGEIGCDYTLTVDGDICQITSVSERRWGQIKVMYR